MPHNRVRRGPATRATNALTVPSRRRQDAFNLLKAAVASKDQLIEVDPYMGGAGLQARPVELGEDQVIEAVCGHLAAAEYAILQRATTTQHGHDVVAQKGGRRVVIEAKGAGSTKAGTARYGKEFSSNQVFDHVAKAVLKALRVASVGTDLAAIALPDNFAHRREVEQVASALERVSVGVFWVNQRGEVCLDAPWEL